MTIKGKKKLKIFIPTAGLGSRLGNLTKNLNKSLIEIGHKPAISHIIDKFPKDSEFVIALGFDSKKVKDFLLLTYPEIKFIFSYVDNFKGPKSSLGYSMECSRKYLQSPFFFVACDSIFFDNIKYQKENWIGYSHINDKNNYRNISFSKKKIVSEIYEKSSKKRKIYPYVGIASILDYKTFWEGIDTSTKEEKKLGESYGLKKICEKKNLHAKKINWYDIGNVRSYNFCKNKFDNPNLNILPKENESIWFIRDKVVKFSQDETFIKRRVLRQKLLNNFTPKIIGYKDNFFLYKKIQGDVLSKKLSLKNFKKLLAHLKIFWKKKKINQTSFQKKCNEFYKNKTLKRVSNFVKKYKNEDYFKFINKKKVPGVHKELSKINWKKLSEGIAVNFHGDLHFENILINKNKFYFLDWRQDFSNIKSYGDLYYELAKLMHGIIVDHNKVLKNHYRIKKKANSIELNLKIEKLNKQILTYFEYWILKNKLDLNKVRILTALIYLNIAPLHHKSYSFFLFHLGKYLLHDIKIFEDLKK